MKNYLLLCLSLVLISSCSPDEPLINSFDDTYRYLVAGRSGLSTISMPDGLVENPNVLVEHGTRNVSDREHRRLSGSHLRPSQSSADLDL